MSWKRWWPSTRAVDTADFPKIGTVCARRFRALENLPSPPVPLAPLSQKHFFVLPPLRRWRQNEKVYLIRFGREAGNVTG